MKSCQHLATLVAALIVVLPIDAQSKHALTIGVETYDPGMFENLRFAEDDAIRIGLALKRTGYETDVMVSTASSARMRPSLASNIWKAIRAKVDACGPADTLVVSLSGHGVQFKDEQPLPTGVKETYFCPETADLGDKSTLVPISKVMELVNGCAAKQKLLLIDSCRDEVISQAGKSKSAGKRIEVETVHESRRSVPGGMSVIFSCQSEEVSWEAKELGHSVFSHFVAEYIDGNADDRFYDQRNIMLDGLVFYVRKKTNDYVFEHNLSSQGQYPVAHGTGANWSLGKPPTLSFETAWDTDEVKQAEKALRALRSDRYKRSIDKRPPIANYETKVEDLRDRLQRALVKNRPATLAWDFETGTSMASSPVVAEGRVFVPTNNTHYWNNDFKHEDYGVLLCLDEQTGDLRWKLLREKLEVGRVNDWPEQGIYSRAAVEQDRLWIITNRCELMCLDIDGFQDGTNDGVYQRELRAKSQDADILWSLDMIDQLGVFPHNKAVGDPVILGDLVIVPTSNGVDESHVNLPSPRAPSIIAANKNTGELVWDWTPEHVIRHGSWSSPITAEVNGKMQVIYGCGDGWLYGLDANTGERIWKADLNPKDAKFQIGGQGDWTSIIAKPLLYENSVIIGTGDDPEHGEGRANLWRIDITKTGDVSAEIGESGRRGRFNPNSAVIWNKTGKVEFDGSGKGFERSMSTAVIHEDCLYTACLAGVVQCIDVETGEPHWGYDLLSAAWGSPVLVNGQIVMCDEDGNVRVFDASKHFTEPTESYLDTSIYATPVVTDDAVYISTRRRLYKFRR